MATNPKKTSLSERFINPLAFITLFLSISIVVYFGFFVSDQTELHAACLMTEHRLWSSQFWFVYGFLAVASAVIAFRHSLVIAILYVLSVSIPLFIAPHVSTIFCTDKSVGANLVPVANALYSFMIPTVSIGFLLFWSVYFVASFIKNRGLWLGNLALISVAFLFLFMMHAYWGLVIEG